MIDERSDEEYLDYVLKSVSPLWLLNSIAADMTSGSHLEPNRKLWRSIGLSSTKGVLATEDDIGAMNKQADARKQMLENNFLFQASLKRLSAINVKPIWGHQEDYSYTSRILILHVPVEALGRLHDLVANDAGLLDRLARREAVERYNRWLLQNYHPEWEAYRRQWPSLEKNPYFTTANDFGRKPNPLQA